MPMERGEITLNCAYSTLTSAELVEKGIGVMALPKYMMREKVAQGLVSVMNVQQKLPPVYISACYKEPMALPLIYPVIRLAEQVAKEFALSCDGDDFWA
jgi:hypothetical protein